MTHEGDSTFLVLVSPHPGHPSTDMRLRRRTTTVALVLFNILLLILYRWRRQTALSSTGAYGVGNVVVVVRDFEAWENQLATTAQQQLLSLADSFSYRNNDGRDKSGTRRDGYEHNEQYMATRSANSVLIVADRRVYPPVLNLPPQAHMVALTWDPMARGQPQYTPYHAALMYGAPADLSADDLVLLLPDGHVLGPAALAAAQAVVEGTRGNSKDVDTTKVAVIAGLASRNTQPVVTKCVRLVPNLREWTLTLQNVALSNSKTEVESKQGRTAPCALPVNPFSPDLPTPVALLLRATTFLRFAWTLFPITHLGVLIQVCPGFYAGLYTLHDNVG